MTVEKTGICNVSEMKWCLITAKMQLPNLFQRTAVVIDTNFIREHLLIDCLTIYYLITHFYLLIIYPLLPLLFIYIFYLYSTHKVMG